MLAYHKTDGGIGNPTVDVNRQIEADQIAVFQVVVERNAMQHRIVHGNANVVCERAGAKIRSVVDVAGFGSLAIDDALVHEFVDFQQIGTNFGEFLEITQNTADETAGGFISSISFGVFSSIMLITLLRTPYSACVSCDQAIASCIWNCIMTIIRFGYTVLSSKMDSVKS